MCLAIPGKIVEIVDPQQRIAKVDVDGVRRNVSIGLLPPDQVSVGDWVLIHVGFAITKIDEEEARQTLEFLQKLGQVYRDEVDQFQSSVIE